MNFNQKRKKALILEQMNKIYEQALQLIAKNENEKLLVKAYENPRVAIDFSLYLRIRFQNLLISLSKLCEITREQAFFMFKEFYNL